MTTEDTPLCYGVGHIFDATDEYTHAWAKSFCDECAMFKACARYRDDLLSRGLRIEGTWAGQLIAPRENLPLYEPSARPDCGTTTGVYLHRRHGEKNCPLCRDYQAQVKAEERRRKRAAS